MINYILQVILFQVLFLAIYDFFLSKETFFNKNRSYLLTTPLLSFLIPLIKIPTFKKAVPQEYIIHLPEIVLSPEKVIEKTEMYQSVNQVNYLNILFWIGVVVFSILFLVKLFKVVNLIRKHQVVKKEFFTLVLIPKQTRAFSFFNFIFLGKEIPVSQQKQIIAHELVHTKQKHSLDLLFFEILKIVMWFNPMIYFYQKRITLIHEYISDEVAAKSATKEMYINNLLSNFFQVENIAFVNQFYKQTLIKKRIIMMKKTQSKKMNQVKYLVLIPVLASMLFYVSCTNSKSDSMDVSTEEYQGKIKIENEFYLIKQNELGETIGVDSNGKEVDVLTLLPESVVALNFKKGKLVNEFTYTKQITNDKAKSSSKMLDEVIVPESAWNVSTTQPDCNSTDKDEQMKCFAANVQNHFSESFNKDLLNNSGLKSGVKRVLIAFKINSEGEVDGVKVRASDVKIKEEVVRVMNNLPKIVTEKKPSNNEEVYYNIPLTIKVI
ncbi:M56 family metallopeptidase [Polaribacter sargassicola]|uniref:M56 family metallopeptidase n=1 Tax=Polaribacter sargassicola TaxID=2836891 RepID=UPI001F2DAD0E|nr:M56 family metallopeptidase [Polaribacter sp. DS7-9]MCG1035862.1 BlaR1 peptidase M56 [Polaribacter sp. DS7-9]